MSEPVVPRTEPESEPEITLVPCPWCESCGLVTPAKAAEWRAAYPELTVDGT